MSVIICVFILFSYLDDFFKKIPLKITLLKHYALSELKQFCCHQMKPFWASESRLSKNKQGFHFKSYLERKKNQFCRTIKQVPLILKHFDCFSSIKKITVCVFLFNMWLCPCRRYFTLPNKFIKKNSPSPMRNICEYMWRLQHT